MQALRSTLFLALLLGVVPSARPATILERNLTASIETSDLVTERTHLRVRMDSRADLDEWSTYAIPLNENRRLLSVKAFALHPDGRKSVVERKHRDTVEHSGESFHSSASYEVLSILALQQGSIIDISFEVETRPYYPAELIWLRGEEPVDELTVRIEGGGSKLRWVVLGVRDDLLVERTAGGLVVSGRDLRGISPPEASPDAVGRSVLAYSWSEDPTWAGVADWYQQLSAGLAEAGDRGRELAQSVIGGTEDPRERLEKLLGYVRREVRYVAVEVGVGGFRPSEPLEVLTRKWGDCKDKSVLLLDLLREAGIEAYPALVLSSRTGRIEADFPSPFQFNHMIVAVPERSVAVGDDDPVSDGFLFVDPTQTLGRVRWLHPGVQDQHALVLTEEGGALARTPLRPQLEKQSLWVTLAVGPKGGAIGEATLDLTGQSASSFLNQAAVEPASRVRETVRSVLAGLLPGMQITGAEWAEGPGDAPALTMTARVEAKALIQGLGGGSPSFDVPSFRTMPAPSELADRSTPAVVRPGSWSVVWNVRVPQGWCLPRQQRKAIESQVGAFVRETRHGAEPGEFSVARRLDVRQRWIEPERLMDLRALALAQYRASKRRMRLTCE